MAESSKPASKRRLRVQKSCTECQRRKQKLLKEEGLQCIIRRQDGPCANCSRRFPPVECVITQVEPTNPKPAYENQVLTFELSPAAPGKLSEIKCPNRWTGDAPASSCPGRSGTFALRPQHKALPNTVTDHWGRWRKPPRGDDGEEKALARVKGSANLFLDGNGDPMAFFHNSPASIGGIIAGVTTLNGMPLPEGPRTAELLHFYIQFVAPNMVSIDGQSQPPVFLAEVLPWMLQSPLFPNIGILMSSMTQSLEQGLEVTKSPESLALKSHVLSIIADYMTRPFDAIAVEMVRSIVNLVVMEWFWGADESMFAHMRGIKRMIKLRGGMRGLGDIVGESIMILTDYEIACCFETDLFWMENDPVLDEELPICTTWPECYDSPLLASMTRFEEMAEKLGLCPGAARILDDVRFLTTSVTSASTLATGTAKIRSTASWLHDKLVNMPGSKPTAASSEGEWMLETIRLAALIYSWAIKSLRQISEFGDVAILEEAYVAMRKVSLTRWKGMPGIFLWIMLVAAPNAAPDAKGRFVRRKMAVTGLSIGFEDFLLGISYLKAFWTVQQWIAKEGDAGVKRLEDKWCSTTTTASGLGREPNKKVGPGLT